MSNWQNIIANSNLIQHSTDKSVLIKVPGSKLKFWHPSKLVKVSGKNGYKLSIGITPEFNVKLFRNGEGQYNFKQVIEEKNVTGQQLIDMFKSE